MRAWLRAKARHIAAHGSEPPDNFIDRWIRESLVQDRRYFSSLVEIVIFVIKSITLYYAISLIVLVYLALKLFSIPIGGLDPFPALEHVQIASGFYGAVGLMSVLITIERSGQRNTFNRGVEAVTHCNERYASLEKERRELEMPGAGAEREWRSFWERYWGLIADEFDHYISGMVDRDRMSSWLLSILSRAERELETAAVDTPASLCKSWQSGLNRSDANIWFNAVIDKLLSCHARDVGRSQHDHVIDMLADIEPLVSVWRVQTQRNLMSIGLYRATLAWGFRWERSSGGIVPPLGWLEYLWFWWRLKLLMTGIPVLPPATHAIAHQDAGEDSVSIC